MPTPQASAVVRATISPTTSPTTFAHMLRQRVPSVRYGTSLTPVQRQAAIENALSLALWHVRNCDGQQALHLAAGKAIRAASLLKAAAALEGGAQ